MYKVTGIKAAQKTGIRAVKRTGRGQCKGQIEEGRKEDRYETPEKQVKGHLS